MPRVIVENKVACFSWLMVYAAVSMVYEADVQDVVNGKRVHAKQSTKRIMSTMNNGRIVGII